MLNQLADLERSDADTLTQRRYRRLRSYGSFRA